MYNRIFWGIVLIGIGILFILDQQGLIEIDIGYIASTFWPLILIYIGLKGLFFQFKWGQGIGFRYLYPLIMITLGVYFLGRNIDYIEMSAGDFFQFAIPVVLIFIGVIIILRPSKRQRGENAEPFTQPESDHPDMNHNLSHDEHLEFGPEDREAPQPIRPTFPSHQPQEPVVLVDPTADYTTHDVEDHQQHEKMENHFSFIGDIHIGSANWQLKPLNIQHFIGDTVIDLTRAHVPYGLTKITVGSMIGDVRILLPSDPDVEASVTMSSFAGESDIFGKREGGMMRNRREESPAYMLAPKKLQIMINTFIGDTRIERI